MVKKLVRRLKLGYNHNSIPLSKGTTKPYLVREQREHAKNAEDSEHFSLAREKPEPLGGLATLNPTNHVITEDTEKYHGCQVVSVELVRFKYVRFISICSWRDTC